MKKIFLAAMFAAVVSGAAYAGGSAIDDLKLNAPLSAEDVSFKTPKAELPYNSITIVKSERTYSTREEAQEKLDKAIIQLQRDGAVVVFANVTIELNGSFSYSVGCIKPPEPNPWPSQPIPLFVDYEFKPYGLIGTKSEALAALDLCVSRVKEHDNIQVKQARITENSGRSSFVLRLSTDLLMTSYVSRLFDVKSEGESEMYKMEEHIATQRATFCSVLSQDPNTDKWAFNVIYNGLGNDIKGTKSENPMSRGIAFDGETKGTGDVYFGIVKEPGACAHLAGIRQCGSYDWDYFTHTCYGRGCDGVTPPPPSGKTIYFGIVKEPGACAHLAGIRQCSSYRWDYFTHTCYGDDCRQ